MGNMCSTCERFEQRVRSGSVNASHGAIAQVVERFHGMEEVESSSLSSSTLRGLADALSGVGFLLAGVVAGEGSFAVTRRLPPFADGTPRLRFVFSLTMASRDRALLAAMQRFLQVGSIHDRPPSKLHHQPTSTYFIGSHRAHHAATIPFTQRFLMPGAKRHQFDLWLSAFRAYETERPSRWGKGPSRCSEEGCERPVRGRGLCRSHYYRATGY
jgi:hypothetical protein